jgi:ribosome recycling factor|tara:strand:+ start:4911 stop:5123 length:213 start_codon:yes stop_codon:yes gene_type:complete
MKIRIVIDTNITKAQAETMERSGFNISPDGSSMQIKVPKSANSSRKAKVKFLNSGFEKECNCLAIGDNND